MKHGETNSGALAVCDAGFATAGGKTPLAGVSVRLEPGAVLAVIGPNGAGKTTLLRLLASELQPTGGRVLLDGLPLPGPAVRPARFCCSTNLPPPWIAPTSTSCSGVSGRWLARGTSASWRPSTT